MNTIVPAILTNNKDECNQMLSLCRTFTDYAQVDIMDGLFVPSKSITQTDLSQITASVKFEAHLMVNDPLVWIDDLATLGAERIIFHFEIDMNHLKIIESIKARKMKVGLALNPATNIEQFEFLLARLDSVLFMSVNPGFYGAPFISDVLEKIKTFKCKYPRFLTGIDGGVKLNNVQNVKASGVDYICVGSAILKAENPQTAYQQFLKTIYA